MLDGSTLSAPPNLRKTSAIERSSLAPIFVQVFSSGGPRIHYLARLAEYLENHWNRQTHQVADLVMGTSAGAVLSAGLTMPCYSSGQAVPDASTLRQILKPASQDILNVD